MKTSKVFTLTAWLLAGSLSFSACKKEDMTPDPTPPAPRTASFNYVFNTGQLGTGTAYMGDHPTTLTARLTITEIDANRSRVEVLLENTIEGATYMVHAHDAADPATTPNGTPYNETPNTEVLTLALNSMGHSGGGHQHRVSQNTARGSQETNRSFEYLTSNYNAFFVVHDPTQPISTTDLSTYLVVGVFAR